MYCDATSPGVDFDSCNVIETEWCELLFGIGFVCHFEFVSITFSLSLSHFAVGRFSIVRCVLNPTNKERNGRVTIFLPFIFDHLSLWSAWNSYNNTCVITVGFYQRKLFWFWCVFFLKSNRFIRYSKLLFWVFLPLISVKFTRFFLIKSITKNISPNK